MKSLGLTAVVTGLSPLRGGTVQVPEHTEEGREISGILDKNPCEVRLTTTTSAEIQEAPPVLCSSPNESKKISK